MKKDICENHKNAIENVKKNIDLEKKENRKKLARIRAYNAIKAMNEVQNNIIEKKDNGVWL